MGRAVLSNNSKYTHEFDHSTNLPLRFGNTTQSTSIALNDQMKLLCFVPFTTLKMMCDEPKPEHMVATQEQALSTRSTEAGLLCDGCELI